MNESPIFYQGESDESKIAKMRKKIEQDAEIKRIRVITEQNMKEEKAEKKRREKAEEEWEKRRRKEDRIEKDERKKKREVDEKIAAAEEVKVAEEWAKKSIVQKASILFWAGICQLNGLAIEGGKKLFYLIMPIVGRLASLARKLLLEVGKLFLLLPRAVMEIGIGVYRLAQGVIKKRKR